MEVVSRVKHLIIVRCALSKEELFKNFDLIIFLQTLDLSMKLKHQSLQFHKVFFLSLEDLFQVIGWNFILRSPFYLNKINSEGLLSDNSFNRDSMKI